LVYGGWGREGLGASGPLILNCQICLSPVYANVFTCELVYLQVCTYLWLTSVHASMHDSSGDQHTIRLAPLGGGGIVWATRVSFIF
jgi:hypothetical protein